MSVHEVHYRFSKSHDEPATYDARANGLNPGPVPDENRWGMGTSANFGGLQVKNIPTLYKSQLNLIKTRQSHIVLGRGAKLRMLGGSSGSS